MHLNDFSGKLVRIVIGNQYDMGTVDCLGNTRQHVLIL